MISYHVNAMLQFDFGARILEALSHLFPIPYLQVLFFICLYLVILWVRLKKLNNRPRITFFSNNPSYQFISTFPNEVWA